VSCVYIESCHGYHDVSNWKLGWGIDGWNVPGGGIRIVGGRLGALVSCGVGGTDSSSAFSLREVKEWLYPTLDAAEDPYTLRLPLVK
jgi:hypothetical protein